MRIKRKCAGCKRLLRSCNLTKNKFTEQMLCKKCSNEIDPNKFFNPLDENKEIRPFSITDTEKKVLLRYNTKTHVNSLCKSLKAIERIKLINNSHNKEKLK